jgi:Butirosin biosynthesis protein H, N-terminal
VLDPPAETVALASALDGEVSAEMLFGLGGGTGFGWFTYGDHATLLTRITTRENSKESFLLDICRRLGLEARLLVASSGQALRKRLEASLAGGEVVIVSVPGPGVSYGAELAGRVTDGLLARAAALPGAARNRGLALRPARLTAASVREAAEAGLLAHSGQMRGGFGPPATRRSFGLAGFDRWRRASATLEPAARARLREQVEGRGGGPGLRLAQAGFLDEVGLTRAAELARLAAVAWSEVAVEPSAERITAVEEAENEALDALEARV